MATHSRTRSDMTLEEFLRWPRIDEKPYLEFYDGRVEVKVSAQKKHSVIQMRLTEVLNRFVEPSRLGLAFPELRCTFAGRSIVPEVVFQLDANIQCDASGEFVNETFLPPDIHIEIRSPDQTVKKTKAKLEHSIANGCPLGWYIDPDRRTIHVYRPGLPLERLQAEGFLDGTPVLPGFRIPFSEVFGWLKYRAQGPANPGADPR
jgi:Uma2 family endonuclease